MSPLRSAAAAADGTYLPHGRSEGDAPRQIKGTLVDFNQLEHALDGVESIGTWQLELRKAHDDPLDLDESCSTSKNSMAADDNRLRAELDNKVASAVEVHPNKIIFESSENMRALQGVNLQLKEQRIVDHRPKPQNGKNGPHQRKRSPLSAPSLVIVDGVRTPFCKWNTALASLGADELGRIAVNALLTRTGLDPKLVDEVIFGCVCQPAEAANVARVIALRAGIPESVPASTVHRNCASGLEAITTAGERTAAGHGSVFIVGGVESMSQVPLLVKPQAAKKFAALAAAKTALKKLAAFASFRLSDLAPRIAIKLGLTDPVSGLNMGETAELLARENEISRAEQDQFAVESHQHAMAAREKLAAGNLPGLPQRPRHHRGQRSPLGFLARRAGKTQAGV